MSKLVWPMIVTLMVLPLLGGVAASEEAVEEPAEDAGPEHVLFLIAPNQSEPQRATPEDTYSYENLVPLDLSQNASESAQESVSMSFQNQQPLGVCTYSCPPRSAVVKAGFVGDDFELVPLSIIDGAIHLSWTYRSSMPPLCCQSTVAAYVYPSIELGDDQVYNAPSFALKGAGGDMVVDLAFGFEQSCQSEDENGTPTECNEPLGGQARDLVLLLRVMPTSSIYAAPYLGSALTIKLDTAGGSSLTVTEVAPPALVGDAVDEVVDETGTVDGENITAPDAEPIEFEGDELHYAPAPMVPLMIAGCLGVVAALRRRRDA